MNIKESVISDIATLIGKGDEVGKKEIAVLSILMLNWSKEKVKQKDIVEHPNWKKVSPSNVLLETSMREVRKVIRKLRVDHSIPILHNSKGHYLPSTDEDVEEFMVRLEREVTRHTSASFETYQIMKNALGATSSLLDRMNVAEVEKVIIYEKV